MRVDIYWNLNRGGYSIRAVDGPNKGRVVGYAAGVDLIDARFIVRPGARERVRRDKVKSVHAWIRGELMATYDHVSADVLTYGRPVTYNPYKFDSFVELDSDGTATPIETAAAVWLRTNPLTGRADVRAVKEMK